MRFRQGFVSNSSSTSFYCPVCDEEHGGYDGEYGFETLDCGACGYTFCAVHFEDLKFDAEKCAKCFRYSDCKEDLEPGDPCMGIDCYEPETDLPNCPICSLETITTHDKYLFALKHFGISSQQFEDIIRTQCGSYEALRARLRNEG
jgi:hypothetical protein